MSIKHLKPRSEEKIQSCLKKENLSLEEKLKTGVKEGILWLVKDALSKGADVHAVITLKMKYTIVNVGMHPEYNYTKFVYKSKMKI